MKQSRTSIIRILVVLVSVFALSFAEKALAQQDEVLLSFRYPAIGSVYVGCLYDNQSKEAFLPVIEIFNLLEINYKPEIKNFTILGTYLSPNNPFSIDVSQVKVGINTYPLKSDDFRQRETDLYLAPKVFEEAFGLKFTVEIAPLILTLETTKTLPVQERKAREQARSRMEGNELRQEDFPLLYDRERSVLNGTMLDYAITADVNDESQRLGYTFTGGMEVLGGDIQGTIYGTMEANGDRALATSDLRWRYAIQDNKFLSGILLGQTTTTGLEPIRYKGFALTNDPIEPRQMFETFVLDGHTEANSEVEIYINDRLTDFKRADEMGYYRFDVPVTYGTTRISTHIYTPSGQLLISDKQMQVPFTFLPRGVVSYNIQGGQTEQYVSDSIQGKWVANGNVAIGLTQWLTASVGSRFLGDVWDPKNLMVYGNLSARLFKQYLLSVDAAPNYFYRLTGSVMYANNLSMNMIFTEFDGASVFNAHQAEREIDASVYVPFKVFGLYSGFRLGGQHVILTSGNQTDVNANLNARLGKIDARFNYRDNVQSSNHATTYGNGLLTSAFTYTVARTPGIPVYVRGMYVRLQNSYDIRHDQLYETMLELSRTVLKTGRLNMVVGRDHRNNNFYSHLGLTLDFTKVRSTTTLNYAGNKLSFRQSLNGSMGWDMKNDRLNFSNRQQVGRSAASVVLFVDNNNSGHYDSGDQLLPYRGVKLDRTTTMEVGKDSILRFSQLQSYYKYNLHVNRNAIPDPTLVPLKDKFSFVADPNQYKCIEIPFYRGGTIEGAVLISRNGQTVGQAGLRLKLKSVEKNSETTIRTMADGKFYSMDIAPGKYTLEVDPAQLTILQVTQPEPLSVEIKALSTGDYLEGLTITLVPVQ